MTVLVTGGAGYIGSHLVHTLIDAGERVVVLDNLTTGFDWAMPKSASLAVGDTGDQPRVACAVTVQAILFGGKANLVWRQSVKYFQTPPNEVCTEGKSDNNFEQLNDQFRWAHRFS